MKRRMAAFLAATFMAVGLLAGCGGASALNTGAQAGGKEADREADREAAARVADLIDAIYVQQRTDETDALCAEAKAAWDALTDAQKELVEGEEADPDYFGRDTGDASKDDPRNQDGIGEKEILVVSFGTSFNDSRVADIKSIEDAIEKANPGWSVRRAFTAQIIINHIQARDGEKIDNMQQALERAVSNGVKDLVIQPTHLMHGAEYDELMEAVEEYRGHFGTVHVAEPLLGQVGTKATETNADKKAVAAAITAEAVSGAGYESLEAAKKDGAAFVFMGHGTGHTAKISYTQMQSQMTAEGFDNVFIGTVEGEPEETACAAVIDAAAKAGYTKIILRPLMVVAGDHANNDMAGDDDDSWKSMFAASGKFERIDVQIAGLGGIRAIQELYVSHTAAAIASSGWADGKAADGAQTGSGMLADGIYSADFNTDSSMFHVNEAYEGRGTLVVKDGQMTLHISLPSKNTVHLFLGLAEDAKKDGAALLWPTIDQVIYRDGTIEEVYGFDIPVPALDEEFALALVGTKGKWYDHKVRVSDPRPLVSAARTDLEDGEYSIDVTMEGGSGRAQIESPATLLVRDGLAYARIRWSSPNYDYMKIGDKIYEAVGTKGNSVFEIPVTAFDKAMDIIADTTAMSEPHEVAYTLTFHFDTVQ